MIARKKSLLMMGLVLTMLLVVLGIVWLLLRHEPAFYRSAAPPTRKDKLEEWTAGAAICAASAIDLLKYFGKGEFTEKDPPPKPEIPFKADWINSFFKQEFTGGSEEAKSLEKQGISEPRVCFDKERIYLGFRYRNFFMTTIISLEMRIWLVPTEINTFAVEILNRRAGALPFPTQALLEEVSNMARKRKIDVNWYRHEGHPVALVRIQTNGPRPTAKFEHIRLEPGILSLIIGANEPPPSVSQVQPRPPAGSQILPPPPPLPKEGIKLVGHEVPPK